MKNTKAMNTIKTRIIASVLSLITIISVVSAATVSASAASVESVIEKASYKVGLAAVSNYVPGGMLISPALDAIFGSFMDNGPSLGDISKDISDMRQLLSSVDELNNEYGRNVQTFTYHKVMEGLIEHGMTVDTEEILEDDSIVLTLNV